MDGKRMLQFAGSVGAAKQSLHFAGRSLASSAQGIKSGFQAVASTVGRTLTPAPRQTATDTSTASTSELPTGNAQSVVASSPAESAPMLSAQQADSWRRPRQEVVGETRAVAEDTPRRRPTPAGRTGVN
jgi:hypothetical protein